MDTRPMVTNNLTSEMVQSGKELITKLDTTDLKIESAFWFFLEESEKWRLFLGSPEVKEKGPKSVYKRVKETLEQNERVKKEITLKDISVIEDDHSLVELMSSAIGTIPNIAEVRFSRNAINGHYIEDALIYRLKYQEKVA